MIFQRSLLANAIGGTRILTAQWNEVRAAREAANRHNLALNQMAGLQVNEGIIPQDVYQDFDNVTVQRMRSDDGDTFLNDLLPLSRSVNIGKLVQKFRQSSAAGNAQTSMSGQIGINMDQVEYSYDGSIIPIHDSGFGRQWREWNAMQSEGFDALIDDQRETVADLREHVVNQFLDGHTDKDGNLIVVDGLSWGGVRNDSRVAQVDLSGGGLNFDFTDNSQTGAAIKAAFIQVRDVLRITNDCPQDAVYYISREIMSNFERKFSTSYDARTILDELKTLSGVADIKETNKMTANSGNELMAFPLDANRIRPVVGMGINTVALPRPVYNSDYNFATWGAIGFQVRTDYSGKTCLMRATG